MARTTQRIPDLYKALKRVPLLRHMDASALEELAEKSRIVDLDRDDRLVSEGDALTSLPVVIEGRLRMAHVRSDGRRFAIATAGPGEAIAAAVALSSSRSRGEVFALEPSTVVLAPVRIIDAAMRADAGFAHSVAIGLAESQVRTIDTLKSFTLDAASRLASELFRLALATGARGETAVSFTLPTTKGQLAAELGLAPESLSRAIARLRDDGLISVERRQVVVHDLKGLAALSSGFTSVR